jgi:hypothetical protein
MCVKVDALFGKTTVRVPKRHPVDTNRRCGGFLHLSYFADVSRVRLVVLAYGILYFFVKFEIFL